MKLGLFEEDGALLEKWEIPTVIEGDGTAVLRDIAAEIQKCREKHNIPADGILGVGAGIPGPVTADGVVHRCVNLGWGVFDVRTALEETVGLPVVVVNDANAAAMGEAWRARRPWQRERGIHHARHGCRRRGHFRWTHGGRRKRRGG